MRLLAIGNALLILVGILSTTFQGIGRPKIPAFVLLTVACAEPIVLWMVVPTQAALGAASVFIGASATALLCLGAVYLRGRGVDAVRQASSWFSRYVVALGIGVIAGYAALGTGLGVELTIVVGGMCYLGAALALRLLFLPSFKSRLLSGRPVPSGEE